MFHLVLGLPWLVVVLMFLPGLQLPWSVELLVAALLLIASQHLLLNRITSGSVLAPEYPRPLIILFNMLFGVVGLLAVFQIALDLVSLVIMLILGRFPSIPVELRYAFGVAAFGLAGFAVSQAIRIPPVKLIDVAIPGLPPAFHGYRLLQLTDLHLSRLFPASWAREMVARSNALDVDLIVITGDFIDGKLEKRRGDVEPLARLRARDGVYSVAGNHEYYFGYQAWMNHYDQLGLSTLVNGHVLIDRNGDRIAIAGVTDRSALGRGLPPPDLEAALAGLPANVPVILLDHQPRLAAQAAKAGVALQLSGHTHGGMVFGLDRLVARANNGFVSGLYRVGRMQLYVNNGTALWPGFALRLGRPSELTVFTLRPAAASEAA